MADSIKCLEINIKGREINKYNETRRRVTDFKHDKAMSDKEIIEFLYDEIEQYRNRIENLDRIIKELKGLNRTKEVDTERYSYNCGVTGTSKEFTVVRWYEDGLLTREEIKPC